MPFIHFTWITHVRVSVTWELTLNLPTVDPSSLVAYKACRLIPLNKNPGVRPIGEVMRRILGKAILQVMDAAGSLQLCAGQDSGIEAAIHSMAEVFSDPATEGVLLADATNAFNSLNREVALRNVQHLCPSLAQLTINTYRQPANLHVAEEVISSEEGTTQGGPIAMVMYAIALIPLMESLATEGAVQAWYADDSGAGGRLKSLHKWWDRLAEKGPQYGYFPNPTKSVCEATVPRRCHKDLCRHWSDNPDRWMLIPWCCHRISCLHRAVCAAEGQ